MKLAIGYSTKDQVELTKQTIEPLLIKPVDLWWVDGSRTDEGKAMPLKYPCRPYVCYGGADAAIAWKLSTLLASENHYTHIGLLENDVLLDPDWFEPTMELFEKGKQDGLKVGAVSPRSYVDRVLIQRDGYAVMHNIGAGAIIFTREAAEIVLRTFRTAWWPDNVRLFAQLSGIDLRTYACFRGNEQWVTTDWGWEAQIAAHGLASLALTPARCQMIGQNPPLEQQGLKLVEREIELARDSGAFENYQANLAFIRQGKMKFESLGMIHRDGASMLFFPHQLGNLLGTEWQGTLGLKWNQGFGPFAYAAGPGGATLSVRASGACSFLVSGGAAGGAVKVQDTRSGFNFAPALPPASDYMTLNVPGTPVPRMLTCELSEGTVFYGLSTSEPQMLDPTFKFDWSKLPEAT